MKYSVSGVFYSEECKTSLYEENSYFLGFFGVSWHGCSVCPGSHDYGGAQKVKYFVKKALSIILITFVV